MTSTAKKYLIGGLSAAVLVIFTICMCIFFSGESRNMRMPDPEKATAKQAVGFFVSNTIDGISKQEKFRFLATFLDNNKSPEASQALSQALKKLSDDDVRRMRDNVIDAAAGGVLLYVDKFNAATSEQEKQKIVNEMMQEVAKYDKFARSIVRNTPNVKKESPSSSTESFNIIMKRVPTAEISKMEPLLVRCLQYRLTEVNQRRK